MLITYATLISRRLFQNNSLKPIGIFIRVQKMSTSTSNDKHAAGLLAIFEKNPKRLERIRFLGQLFNTNGFELRIAGGAVRDILTGVEPTDIDFATTARPEETLKIVSQHEDIFRIIVTAAGQKHGTVAVKFKEVELDFKRIKLNPSENNDEKKDDSKTTDQSSKPEYDEESPFEITTLRCDTDTDGRHAEVKFVNDWKIDAERRDLTINAMFLTLDEGKLVDYFDGQSDLKEGRIRFVGSAKLRITEDYLRILRFFRFWSRYGKNMRADDETLETLKSNMEGLKIISGERIWVELKKVLSHIPCSNVLKLMMEMDLFKHLEITDNFVRDKVEYVDQVYTELGKVEKNVQQYLKLISNQNLNQSSTKRMKELAPVILFSTAIQSEDMLLNAHKRLKFSNIEKDSLSFIVLNRTKEIKLSELKQDLSTVHTPERPQTLLRMKTLLVYLGRQDLVESLDAWQIPDFPITGVIVAKQAKKMKLPGTKIKVLIELLKHEWAMSDYKLNSSELEKKLIEKCDEMTSKIKDSKQN